MTIRARLALVAGAATLAAAAAAPAGSEAAAPPPMCFESPEIAFCTSDVGPFVNQTLKDPASAVPVAENVVCDVGNVCTVTG